MGLPRFQRHPFVSDMLIDPGGATSSRFIDNAHTAFSHPHSLGLRNFYEAFRGSFKYPIRPLSTLRTPRYHDARKTRSQPARYALAGQDFHLQDAASLA